MNVTGYPDLLSYSRLRAATADIKARLDVTSQEVVTGLKADVTTATQGRVGEAHLLQKAQNDLTHAENLNVLSHSRLTMISGAINGARTLLDNIDTRAIIALNSANPANIDAISTEAKDSLDMIMSVMNTKHGERYLMSGDQTNIAPFEGANQLLSNVTDILSTAPNTSSATIALDAYFAPGGQFDTDIYHGSDDAAPRLPLGNGAALEVDIRGNTDAIKQVLRGLAIMATAQDSPLAMQDTEFEALYSIAAADVALGNSGLISLETELGIHLNTIDQAQEQNIAESSAIALSLQNLLGRDQYEAAAELQTLETQLQASYTVTARLSDLTLTSFLR